MTEDLSKKLSFIFHVVAIAIVITYAISSYQTFEKNDDLCEVNFKKYHSDKDSIYPSISLCFNTPFLDEKLTEHATLINVTDYQNYLLGRNEEIGPFLNIPYENVSLQEHHVFTKFVQRFKAENKSRSMEKDTSIDSWAWFIGVMKCFTYNIPYENEILSSFIEISFLNNVFPKSQRPSDGWNSGGFQVFFHYPKHFSRSLTTNKRFWPMKQNATKYSMRFYLKGMEVLKRRHKESFDCSDIEDYDDWLIKNITKTVNCIPPYWKNINNLSICKTAEDLLLARQMFYNVFYVGSEDNPPCKEISKLDIEYEEPDDVEYVPENQTQLDVYFRNNFYKEIHQMQAYTMMSLVGNVGGFVGLLLGYALVQIPGLMFMIYNCLSRKFHEHANRKQDLENCKIHEKSSPKQKIND